jgi:geranylgeranyl pyrophosphate synthase
LFLISRAIFNNHQVSKEGRFEESTIYNQVKTLAACIEIAHNASLLQDDIIDKADSRRSKEAAHKVSIICNTNSLY